jgi:hypothetical protein
MENSNLEEQKYIRAKKRVKAIKGFYVHLTVYIVINAFLLLSRAFSDESLQVFFQWQSYNTLLFWGIGIVFHAFNVFGMNLLLGANWESRKIKEYMEKDKRDLWE